MWEEAPIQQLWGLVKLKLSIRFWSLVRRAIKVQKLQSFQQVHTCNDHCVCYYIMGGSILIP